MNTPTVGTRWRAPSTGSVYEVERVGTSLSDPCVLKLVCLSDDHRSQLAAEAEQRGEHLMIVLQEAKLQPLRVEPAWFEHAGRRVG